ncbi:hypothetical protein SAMN05421824_1462 [Hyunsoonleella jejuensis]|uniref:Uncharacterized protein n=1 Tax=Hyunsoonleella jejuensis TaxID=419940 RepID=A0A1H9FF38_9FLAO|nr:hypothetical protein [Hyunsoonleella jejuensis]SEQ36544.1 hypothetical protein SAMN05421824_1462 [Hyunsoonleella jejuensis]
MKYFNYSLILLGAIVAMYAKAGEQQNQLLLISGIIILMVGVYRISRTIPSKRDNNQDEENR